MIQFLIIPHKKGQQLNTLNKTIIQSEHGIIIDKTHHIINNSIQKYWGTNKKEEIGFQKQPFTIGTQFKKYIFMATKIIVKDLKNIEK